MKITKVRIHNYRSFNDISLNMFPYTVIVGQNNVGKSNILRAIELFFSSAIIRKNRFLRRDPFGRYRYDRIRENKYSFERDFPVASQSNPGKKCTKVSLTFDLEKKDFDNLELNMNFRKFQKLTISKIIRVGKVREDETKYRCAKLKSKQLKEFLSWVFKTSDFVRIPSSRASDASNSLLRSFSNRIFSNLKGSYKLKRALAPLAIRAGQEIKKAEKSILTTLVQFIPELESLNLELGDLPEVSDILDISNIKINDGTLTYLSNKGDGVQSLFYIGLMQYAASLKVDRNLIFGIEEPELHLHPDAQDELTKALRSISDQNQVILTTHSPVLVNRSVLEHNIVVRKDKNSKNIQAINTRSILTIRSVLGVKPSHNLKNAKLVILAEGLTDERVIEHIVKIKSNKMEDYLQGGELRITHAQGTTGIVNELEHYKRELQPAIALFDDDKEGREGYQKCIEEDILEVENVFKIPSRESNSNTEMEDLFPLKYTINALKESFGIKITVDEFNS